MKIETPFPGCWRVGKHEFCTLEAAQRFARRYGWLPEHDHAANAHGCLPEMQFANANEGGCWVIGPFTPLRISI